jgi:hypothetical protein
MRAEEHAGTPVTISRNMENVNLKKKILILDRINCTMLLLLMMIFSDTFFPAQKRCCCGRYRTCFVCFLPLKQHGHSKIA